MEVVYNRRRIALVKAIDVTKEPKEDYTSVVWNSSIEFPAEESPFPGHRLVWPELRLALNHSKSNFLGEAVLAGARVNFNSFELIRRWAYSLVDCHSGRGRVYSRSLRRAANSVASRSATRCPRRPGHTNHREHRPFSYFYHRTKALRRSCTVGCNLVSLRDARGPDSRLAWWGTCRRSQRRDQLGRRARRED